MGNFILLVLYLVNVLQPFISVEGIPVQIKGEDTIEKLNKEISQSESAARMSKIFYAKNVTFQEQSELPKKLFSHFLESIGWKKVEHLVSMSWNEIFSVKGPIVGSRQFQRCKEIFHPDHFLSNVILENLITSKTLKNDRLMEEITQLFCSRRMKSIALNFMHTEDVITGLVIYSINENGSVLSLANVGF